MIEVKNMSKYYGEFQALKNISFSIKKSSIVGLIGSNGAGKTTIIKNMVKLLEPDSGEILLDGKNISKLSEYPVSYIPDEPVYFEELTLYENLLFLCKIYKSDKNKILELSDRFKISEYFNNFPSQLSKGNQQKMMIVFSILRGFDLLIADEPFNGLDPEQINEFKNLLISLRNEGKTIMLSTHLLDLAETICDSFIFINRGMLVAEGTKKELLDLSKSSKNSLESIFIDLVNQRGHI